LCFHVVCYVSTHSSSSFVSSSRDLLCFHVVCYVSTHSSGSFVSSSRDLLCFHVVCYVSTWSVTFPRGLLRFHVVCYISTWSVTIPRGLLRFHVVCYISTWSVTIPHGLLRFHALFWQFCVFIQRSLVFPFLSVLQHNWSNPTANVGTLLLLNILLISRCMDLWKICISSLCSINTLGRTIIPQVHSGKIIMW
jgi:hypothetical protein